jgi:chemotaxis protein CheZ
MREPPAWIRAESSPPLSERLQGIRARHPGAEPEAVAEVVRAVLATMQGDLTAPETTLLAQVEELGRTIAVAKAEIAALHVDDITVSQIPSATDELDAIVAHTATATEQILESCEMLDRLGGELSGVPATSLQEATTRIYEACSFQDITGQRITKVVTTLKTIEAKVAQIVATFGERREAADAPPAPALAADAGAGEVAMHGPQLPANAMDQSDIDALLASFD